MRSTRIQLLFGAALLAEAAAAADPAPVPPDTSGWECKKCPFDSGSRLESEAGGAYVSDDAARAGDGLGYQEKGGYLIANLEGKQVGEDGKHLEYGVEQAGLESRSAYVSGGDSGRYDWRLSYDELPHFIYDTTETVFTDVRSSDLGLPAGWVRGSGTAGMTTLANDLHDVNIENKRQTLGLEGEYRFGKGFSLSATYSREERDGLRAQGGPFGTTTSQLPIDLASTTDQVEIALRHRSARGDLSLAFYGSFFDTDDPARTWANPFIAWAPGADVGQMAAAPENSFQQVMLSGGYSFPLDTHLSFSASTGKMEQDEDLLPYTINPQIAVTPLPRTSLDGEVTTTDFQVSLTSRPLPRTRVRASYHFDDRDNDTPVESWDIVEADGIPWGTFENVPYGFTRERLSVGGQLDLPLQFRLSGGYDRVEMERPLQEVEDQLDETGWGQLSWHPSERSSVSMRGGATYREIGTYGTVADAQQNPLMRKYNLADRDRQFGEARLAVAFGKDLKYSLDATVTATDDEYNRSFVGLLEGSERTYALDFSWAASEKVAAFLRAGYDRIESVQAGSETFSSPDWSARNRDEFSSAGAGVRWLGIGKKADLTFDYTYGLGEGHMNIDRASLPPDPMPDLETRVHTVRLNLAYHWSDSLEIVGDLRYEDSDAEDWALDGVGPATVPNLLSLGAEAYDYDVLVFGLSFRYFFGQREPSMPPEEEAKPAN
jgi:MtrB/PioB family decaheme-associated outer membrane protein